MRNSRARAVRSSESGYSLVALMAVIAVTLILMSAAMPSWRYVMKNDREEELLFRGGEIADAVMRYQRKNGNALPPSLEVLVKGKYLRHAYKDPMTKDGKWRFLKPGDALLPLGPNPLGPSAGSRGTVTTTTTTTTRPSAFSSPLGGPQGAPLGGFQGVASTSKDTSLRMFNGRTRYDEWFFLPGQPRIVGRPTGMVQPGAPFPGGRPGVPGGTMPGGIPPGGGIGMPPGGGVGIPPNLAPPPPPADP